MPMGCANAARVVGFWATCHNRARRDRTVMDFALSEEQQAFQATAREFAVAEMMPRAREWDEHETFPVEALRKAAALGFGGIYVKEDVGGSALTRLAAAPIFEGTREGC